MRRISELIQDLETIKDEHGDMVVAINERPISYLELRSHIVRADFQMFITKLNSENGEDGEDCLSFAVDAEEGRLPPD